MNLYKVTKFLNGLYHHVPICKLPERISRSFHRCASDHAVTQELLSTLPRADDKSLLEAKNLFNRVINEAYFLLDCDVKPHIKTEQIISDQGKQMLWTTTIDMCWPEQCRVQGVAMRKTDSEKLAYLDACQKLKDFGSLDQKNNPVLLDASFSLEDKSFKSAKGNLSNVFEVIWPSLGNQNLRPRYKNVQVPGIVGNVPIWKSMLTLEYPETQTFQGYSYRQNCAENIAATKALKWLHDQGTINHRKQPILYSRKDVRAMIQSHEAPCPIFLPPTLQAEMSSVWNEYKDVLESEEPYIKKPVELINLEAPESALGGVDLLEELENESLDEKTVRDVMTERSYTELNEEVASERNLKLYEHQVYLELTNNPELKELQHKRKTFPIYEHRENIVKLINENRVVVISGDTGCGKSTQVPQYILDYFTIAKNGAACNIVVTQPRRISAITLSQYVASERGEKVGETVGHQVRLKRSLPIGNGAILFCSTGILLRKLCNNNDLLGISHVIIDEVHERNIPIDFLLILLKRLLDRNKDIKLILMSATFNTSLFSAYFNHCPVLHIPGQMHPVTEYYIDDLPPEWTGYDKSRAFGFNSELVSRVIINVDKSKGPGAILCFLPGWNEIKAVSEHLKTTFEDASKYKICCLHSRLLPEEQERAFVRPSPDVRKIILSTNIAETSVTINDVVYVIDSGFHKGMSFDTDKGISSLGLQYITKANLRQRRGRAGRVQPGICYHLFPRKVFPLMKDYPIPEMLNTHLEKVVLDCKVYCPEEKAEDFLSDALQPPSKVSVHLGVQELQVLGVLDSNEDLTALGETIKQFATHPRLSKALVYATLFRCLDPALSVAAFLTVSQEPFLGSLDNKEQIRDVKKQRDQGKFSDHMALSELFNEWDDIEDESAQAEFVESNLLDSSSMTFIKQLKGLFIENMKEVYLVPKYQESMSSYDCNNGDTSLCVAALTSAFYPNVVKLLQGEISRGKLDMDSIIYSTLRGQKALIQDESVASKVHELPSPWLIYFMGVQSEARRMMMTNAVTSVPAISFLLFTGQELSVKQDPKNDNGSVLMSIDNSSKLLFSCTCQEAELISQWRQMLQDILQTRLVSRCRATANQKNVLEFFDYRTLPILKALLKIPQIPFAPDTKYTFADGEIQANSD